MFHVDELYQFQYSIACWRDASKGYKACFVDFINFYPEKALNELTEGEIKEYMMHLVEERNVSESYQNQAINAIKFYYEKVLGGDRKYYNIDRPFKPKKLPIVLSEEEVKRIIQSIYSIGQVCRNKRSTR